jgi:hypothetical protein
MNENDVYAQVLLDTPTTYDNLVRDGIRANPQGGGIWFPEIHSKNIPLQQGLPTDGTPAGGGTTPGPSGPASDSTPLDPAFSWDTTGGTDTIFVSYGTMEKKSAAGHTATDKTRAQAATDGFTLDNQRVIGSSNEGVRGAEKVMPVFRWSVEVARSSVDKAYLRTLRNLTGKVNNATFYQWPEGDVLYKGASGRNTNGRWMITHSFEVSETRVTVDVGNGITMEKVKGFELLVIEYMKQPIGGRGLSVPWHAYVEQIYEPANFSLIGIGT